MDLKRSAGILMPVSALPNQYGIGTFGKCAFSFVDFLRRSNLSYWQILPLNPISYGDSPYFSTDVNAIAYQYIDMDILIQKGLLKKEELKDLDQEYTTSRVDYHLLHTIKLPLLKLAFSRFDKEDKEFQAFVNEKKYHDYAIFMTIKELHNYNSWTFFNERFKKYSMLVEYEIATRYNELYLFWVWTMFEAQDEWFCLKAYANKNGIKIIGDMAFYTAYDSVDVWKNPEMFALNEDKTVKYYGGCPPDNTYPDGQMWGVPCYDFEEMKKNNYAWWDKRIQNAFFLYDVVRLDHFRGFDKYYAIDGKTLDAHTGVWKDGPGLKFLERYKDDNIIAEDLGFLDESFYQMKKSLPFYGMKVSSYAFDGRSDNDHNPLAVKKNNVIYSSTHDNMPLSTFILNRSEDALIYYKNELAKEASVLGADITGDSPSDLAFTLCEMNMASDATIAILSMWDLLGLDYKARFNLPNTVSKDNWSYRFKSSDFHLVLNYKLYKMAEKFKR